ncbi:MAG: glycoside hydrolase family 25 protein [Lachnospiraceae bacterium]
MQKKKEILFYIFTIISCVFAMTVVVISAILVYDKLQNKEKKETDKEVLAQVEGITYSKEEVDLMLADAIATTEKSTRERTSEDILGQLQASLEGGTTVVESLRPLYKDHIVVVSNGKFYFVPINEDLRMSTLVQENLQVLENGEIQYVEDGKVVSHKGIDVSRYQGNIDWKQVKESGVEFAIIRLGIRGYGTEGKLSIDEKFLDNVKGANAAGVKVGVYFFTQAITEEEALEEANLVLENIKDLKVDYPIVLDVEKTSAKDGRMNQLTVEERTKVVHVFIDRIKESGYTPMIYSNMEMWSVLLNMDEFEDVDKWYAYYTPTIYFPYEYAIWQYSDKGRVPGIEGDVDLNISFKEW